MARILKKEKRKQERGITLIALITTIIVLLILAGISIGAITGSNGIIGGAQSAKEETEIANEKEIIDISTVEAMGKNNRGNLEEEEFQNAIDKHTNGKASVSDVGEEFEVLFEESNRYYTVDKNGNILDYITGVTDSYPGDITKKEDGTVLDGSEEHPYEINCIEDLVAFSNMVNKTGKVYQDGKLIDAVDSKGIASGSNVILTRDLNFKSSASYIDSTRTDFGDINGDAGDGNALITEMTTGTGFPAIGKYQSNFSTTFSGVFDGENHSIKNLYKSALFGNIRGSEIKNITVYGVEGVQNSSGIIEGVEWSNIGVTSIINCINYMDVKSNDNPAGIVGASNEKTMKIINCINYGDIEGGNYGLSGILGNYNTSGGNLEILNSCNLGNLNFPNYGISYSGCGGIIGLNQYTSKITLINCFSTGTISGVAVYKGNLIGHTANSQLELINTYNIDNGFKEVGNGSYEGTVETKTLEEIKTQGFVDILNSYKDDSGNYPTDWKKWTLGENGYPTFVEN